MLQHLGRYKELEDLSWLALKGGKIVLGSFHADTLTSMKSLVPVLQHQGEHKQALKLSQQTLDDLWKTLGKCRPAILASMSNLALVP